MQKIERILKLWDTTLPSFFRRWWPLYAQALEEGFYFIKRPALSAALPLIFLGLGFLMGAWHLGYEFVISESLFLMILVILFSFLSTQWGALWWAGYCLGDFLLFRMHYIFTSHQNIFGGVLRIGAPSIIYYTLLALLVIYIPLLTRLLAQKSLRNTSFQNNKIMNTGLHVFISGSLIYFWNQAYPLLIRPVWTWNGQNPTVQAIEPIQKTGWVLVLCAMLAFITYGVLKDKIRRRLLDKTELPISPFHRQVKIPTHIRILLKSVFSTFLLSGLILKWWNALLLFFIFMILYSWRAGYYLKLPSLWIQWLTPLPLLIRLTFAIVVSWVMVEPIHNALWQHSENTFLPIVLTISLSLIMIYLVCPNETQGKHEKTQ